MIRIALFFSLVLFQTYYSYAQSEVLDQYIGQALESNITLQQKELSYEKSLKALEEAKAMYFPSLSFEARYSRAAGGRTIDFPIGDLLNPVYDNLDLINARNSNSVPDYPSLPAYPNLLNEQINFLREQEHETKLRVVFPIFNSSIRNNHKLKEKLSKVERISVDIYQRELVKEVKVAYFNYLQSREALQLFENTKTLVQENLRTSQSLQKNHKVTADVVYAAQAQVKLVEQQLAEARKNEKTAQAYFNFLLNRNYDEGIKVDPGLKGPAALQSIEQARTTAFKNREEFRQLDQYLKISEQKIKLEQGGFLPQLNLVADYGFQGTTYSFGRNDDYLLGSVVMSWNIFNRPTRVKVQQAQLDQSMIYKRQSEVQQQIGLEVVNAYYDLEASGKNIELTAAELESNQKAFKLVNKKFVLGQANLVEWTEARTQMTNAAQKHIIAKFAYEVKLALLERSIGSYQF